MTRPSLALALWAASFQGCVGDGDVQGASQPVVVRSRCDDLFASCMNDISMEAGACYSACTEAREQCQEVCDLELPGSGSGSGSDSGSDSGSGSGSGSGGDSGDHQLCIDACNADNSACVSSCYAVWELESAYCEEDFVRCAQTGTCRRGCTYPENPPPDPCGSGGTHHGPSEPCRDVCADEGSDCVYEVLPDGTVCIGNTTLSAPSGICEGVIGF